jgi:hypothetical protein
MVQPPVFYGGEPDGGILDLYRGEFSGSADIVPNGPRQSLVRVSAINRSNPQVLTLSWAVRQTAARAGGDLHRPQLGIKWGSGRGFFEVAVDVKRGGQLSLSGQTVDVDAGYLGNTGPDLHIIAALALGSPAGVPEPPTFTEAPANIAAGAQSADIIVPDFATSVQIVQDTDPLAAAAPICTVQFYANAAAGALIGQAVADRDQTLWLPNRCEVIRVTNARGAAAVNINPVFRLAL